MIRSSGTDPRGLIVANPGSGTTASWTAPSNSCSDSAALTYSFVHDPNTGKLRFAPGSLGFVFDERLRDPSTPIFIDGRPLNGDAAGIAEIEALQDASLARSDAAMAQLRAQQDAEWWQRNVNNRAAGGLQVVVGIGETAGGSALLLGSGVLEVGSLGTLTPVAVLGGAAGGAFIFNGIDTSAAGSLELVTGIPQPTLTQQMLTGSGLDPDTAANVQSVLQVGGNLANMAAPKPWRRFQNRVPRVG